MYKGKKYCLRISFVGVQSGGRRRGERNERKEEREFRCYREGYKLYSVGLRQQKILEGRRTYGDMAMLKLFLRQGV